MDAENKYDVPERLKNDLAFLDAQADRCDRLCELEAELLRENNPRRAASTARNFAEHVELRRLLAPGRALGRTADREAAKPRREVNRALLGPYRGPKAQRRAQP